MLSYFATEVTNMKNKFLPALIPLLAITLASCIRRPSRGSSSSSSNDPEGGYVQLSELSMLSEDLDHRYAPALGDVKLLVVPITFAGTTTKSYESYIQPWSSGKLNDVNRFYFGETNSLSAYYKTASFNKLRITGMVADIYENNTYSVKSILNDGSMKLLWDMMDAALTWVQETRSDIDWKEYDLNQDGCIDNIHFVTDFVSNNWGDNLWPHMYFTNRTGTIDQPMVNVYSMSGTGFVDDAITAIHEQGHIFGLDDYYDYSQNGESSINYIGGFDMQSHNVFDWNSFSKLTTGWVNPYVIDGSKDETYITLKAASLNGDCLIIPADYSTFNGSAFDEYFLIELFAPYGNNKDDWNRLKQYLGEEPGIRMYHVDGRVFGSEKVRPGNNMQLIVDDLDEQIINSIEDSKKWTYNTRGANNCSDWRDYEGGIEQLGNYPMLSIVQKGGQSTFSKAVTSHRYLMAEDLFKKGDVFTFQKYSRFLNKSGIPQESMNTGETFPYKIEVLDMDEETTRLKITKI